MRREKTEGENGWDTETIQGKEEEGVGGKECLGGRKKEREKRERRRRNPCSSSAALCEFSSFLDHVCGLLACWLGLSPPGREES